MRTLMGVVLIYLAVLTLFVMTGGLLGVQLGPVTLLVSPAVVASIFLVTGLSELDPKV